MNTITRITAVSMLMGALIWHPQVHAAKWVISVVDFEFSPALITNVQVGDTIHWIWMEGSHTTTSTNIPEGADSWNESLNFINQSFEYIPQIEGTYDYVCLPHEGMGMVGSFIVEAFQPLNISIRIFLEGPFNGSSMSTVLADKGFMPLQHPYNPALPYYSNFFPVWLHLGNESVPAIPAGVVDWVVVEYRDALTASEATGATALSRNVYFINSDGYIVDLDGLSTPTLSIMPQFGLFTVIYHRNHLAVMNSNPLTSSEGSLYHYDFTTGPVKFYDGSAGSKELSTGIWGMIAGDSNGDNVVNSLDKVNAWEIEAGHAGYIGSDLSLESQADNSDKTGFWESNLGKSSSIP
jgi:plastocyanin